MRRVVDALVSATRARPTGRNTWLGHCPSHEDRRPSLSITLAEDRILLYCFAGCSVENIVQSVGLEVRDLFGGERERDWTLRLPPEPRQEMVPNEEQRAWLEKLWGETQPIETSQVALRYLEARGLDPGLILPDLQRLRFHPSLVYWEEEEGKALGEFPALVARVEHPSRGFVALHRTYLVPDGSGKAPVPSPKKLSKSIFPGATKGGAIALYPPGPVLVVAEGIETAFAVRQVTGLPVWATVSAGGMKALLVPEGVRKLLIAADGDPPGIRAAHVLARRATSMGIRSVVRVPPVPKWDWLDALLREPLWVRRTWTF